MIIIGGIYQHYKRGTHYRIICEALLEATEEPCIVYEALDPERSKHQRFWVRSKQDFLAMVEHEGKMIPRFSLVENV